MLAGTAASSTAISTRSSDRKRPPTFLVTSIASITLRWRGGQSPWTTTATDAPRGRGPREWAQSRSRRSACSVNLYAKNLAVTVAPCRGYRRHKSATRHFSGIRGRRPPGQGGGIIERGIQRPGTDDPDLSSSAGADFCSELRHCRSRDQRYRNRDEPPLDAFGGLPQQIAEHTQALAHQRSCRKLLRHRAHEKRRLCISEPGKANRGQQGAPLRRDRTGSRDTFLGRQETHRFPVRRRACRIRTEEPNGTRPSPVPV